MGFVGLPVSGLEPPTAALDEINDGVNNSEVRTNDYTGPVVATTNLNVPKVLTH